MRAVAAIFVVALKKAQSSEMVSISEVSEDYISSKKIVLKEIWTI